MMTEALVSQSGRAIRRLLSHPKRMLRAAAWRLYPVLVHGDLWRQRLVRRQQVEPDVVVSLTTYPPRLPVVHIAIKSVLRGSTLPEHLVLWLPEGQIRSRDVPRALRRLTQRGLTIRPCSPNFRSANKLVHALSAFPNARIVTIDDDTMYPRHWLRDLVSASDRTPDAVIAYRAHRLVRDNSTDRIAYSQSLQQRDHEGATRMDLLPTGCSGVLYPPGSLDEQVHDLKAFRRLCPTGDDLWFRAMGLLRGTAVRRVRPRSCIFPEIGGSQQETLAQMNNERHANERMLDAVAEAYGVDFAEDATE